MAAHVPLAECVVGHVYRVRSFNLGVAAYDGDGRFVGLRSKFDRLYLDTEYHADMPDGGSVLPLEDLGPLPEGVSSKEFLGTADRVTGRPIAWDGSPATPEQMAVRRAAQLASDHPHWSPLDKRGNYFTDTGEYSDAIRGILLGNDPLHEFLKSCR